MTITITSISSSDLVDTKGAVDADVTIDGLDVSVTLVPSECHGELDTWGDVSNWLSQPDILPERDLGRAEVIDRIVQAVRAAAEAM